MTSNLFTLSIKKSLLRILFPTLIILLSTSLPSRAATDSKSSLDQNHSIKWQKFDAESFGRAKKENKFILLDLVAVWCHWCHVMEEKTYQDPQVISLINSHFIPVQADHDLRPDLADRYREWGWPATIIITPNGTEIMKRAGYINPEDMAKVLQAIIDNPSPESKTLTLPDSLSTSPTLSEALLKILQKNHLDAYDTALGGLRLNQKFLDAESVEWDLYLASQDDKVAKQRVQQTLKATQQLIDPEFGGAYQYSTHADWQHPHYEKIMRTQQKYLTTYAQACLQLKDKSFCESAEQIANYLVEFLFDPDKGAFYTSQDADLTQGEKSQNYFALTRKNRLALGLPRIDKHHYAAHNGRAIEGMAMLYQATQNKKYLQYALQATQWVLKNRRYFGGGFRHNQLDNAGPYLADTLYMGKAFLTLYNVTKEKDFLEYASQTADFIATQFKNTEGGLLSAVDNGTPIKPLPQLDQNIDAARFLIQLTGYTQKAEHRTLTEHTLKLLATEKIATSRLTEAGILLAMKEYRELNSKK